MKKGLLAVFTIIALGAAYWVWQFNPVITPSETGNGGEVSTDQPLQAVALSMGYIPDVQFTPFYVAREEGFFAAQGVEAEFDHGFVNEIIPLVGRGERDFAIVDGDQVLLGRGQGIPVVSLLSLYPAAPVGIVSRAENNITSAADLAGKRVGLPGLYGSSYLAFLAWLEVNGIDQAELSLEAIGYTQVEGIATDRLDAAVVFLNNEPLKLSAQGIAVNTIAFSDDVDYVGASLITSEAMIAGNPELVQKVVAALSNGMRWASDNPASAFAMARQYLENLDDEQAPVQQQILTASIAQWQLAADKPAGTHLENHWQATYNWMNQNEFLNTPYDFRTAFTNNFLPEQ